MNLVDMKVVNMLQKVYIRNCLNSDFYNHIIA
jgi:hypothetical protein